MYHIGLLIMAAMAKLAPDFIKEGRLCWLRSPLFIATSGKKRSYYFNDEEYDKAKNAGLVKGEVIRCKGLGTLEAEEARESMFTDKYQRLEIMEYSPEAMKLLEALMGESVEPRRDYILKNVDFSEVVE